MKPIEILKNYRDAITGNTFGALPDPLPEGVLKAILAAQWNRVEDGLPTEGGQYWVKYGEGFSYQYDALEHINKRWLFRRGEVTHWSEITKPEEG